MKSSWEMLLELPGPIPSSLLLKSSFKITKSMENAPELFVQISFAYLYEKSMGNVSGDTVCATTKAGAKPLAHKAKQLTY